MVDLLLGDMIWIAVVFGGLIAVTIGSFFVKRKKK